MAWTSGVRNLFCVLDRVRRSGSAEAASTTENEREPAVTRAKRASCGVDVGVVRKRRVLCVTSARACTRAAQMQKNKASHAPAVFVIRMLRCSAWSERDVCGRFSTEPVLAH